MTDRSEHLVESLPSLSTPFPTRQYAGHLPVDDSGDRQLFYWLFAPPVEHEDTAPLVVWLNGGPYYSSLVGLFLENGPFRIVNRTAIQLNPHSWHTAPAWMLYVDQPVGTGLSFANDKRYCTDDACICADFSYFLRQFLWLHQDDMLVKKTTIPSFDYALSRRLYFSGESYAGNYIPTIIDYIMQQNMYLLSESSNANNTVPSIYMPVAGAAIGNGYMDPRSGYNNAAVEFGYGLMDLSQKAFLDTREEECNKLVDDQAKKDQALDCYDEYFCDFDVSGTHAPLEVCDYNANLWFPAGKQSELYPLGRGELEAFLNEKSVLEAIHATAFSIDSPHERKFQVQAHLHLDKYHVLQSVADKVVRLLEEDVHLLFYNGILDLMCDHYTNEKFLSELSWEGRDSWVTAKRYAWNPFWQYNHKGDIVSMERPSGFAKEYGGLSFLKILDAGHMAPMDQPEVSLAMLQTLLRGDPFVGAEQRLGQLDTLKPVVPIEKPAAVHVPSPATSDDTHVDDNFHWITLGCIVLAACVGFFTGRWSKKTTNYAVVADDQSFTNSSCIELGEVT